MNRKMIYIVVVVLWVMVALPVQAREDTAYTLGLSLPEMDGAFYGGLSDSAIFTANEAETELIVEVSDYDVETELANVQDLIDQGIDALLLSPTDPVESVAAIEVANAAGVPVFVIGDVVLAEDAEVEIAGQIAPNNAAAGELAGEAVCELADEAGAALEVVSLDEEATMSAVMDRSASFETYMADNCADMTIMLVNVFALDFDGALDAILAALDEQDFDLIVGLDDVATLAAISAQGNYRMMTMKNLTVIGLGTRSEISASLEQELLAALIVAEPWPLGETSVETSLAYLNGEDVEATVEAVMTILRLDTLNVARCPNGVPPSACSGR